MLSGVEIALPGEMICKISIQLNVFLNFESSSLIGDSSPSLLSFSSAAKERNPKQQNLKTSFFFFLKHCSQASSDSWPVLLTVSKYVALTCSLIKYPSSFYRCGFLHSGTIDI